MFVCARRRAWGEILLYQLMQIMKHQSDNVKIITLFTYRIWSWLAPLLCTGGGETWPSLTTTANAAHKVPLLHHKVSIRPSPLLSGWHLAVTCSVSILCLVMKLSWVAMTTHHGHHQLKSLIQNYNMNKIWMFIMKSVPLYYSTPGPCQYHLKCWLVDRLYGETVCVHNDVPHSATVTMIFPHPSLVLSAFCKYIYNIDVYIWKVPINFILHFYC